MRPWGRRRPADNLTNKRNRKSGVSPCNHARSAGHVDQGPPSVPECARWRAWTRTGSDCLVRGVAQHYPNRIEALSVNPARFRLGQSR